MASPPHGSHLREPHDHAARAPALTKRLCAFLQRPTVPARFKSWISLAGRVPRCATWRRAFAGPSALVDGGQRRGFAGTSLPAGAGSRRRHLSGSRCGPQSPAAGRRRPGDRVGIARPRFGDWLDRLVAAASPGLASLAPALLLALSYDGSMAWQPLLPDDRLGREPLQPAPVDRQGLRSGPRADCGGAGRPGA